MRVSLRLHERYLLGAVRFLEVGLCCLRSGVDVWRLLKPVMLMLGRLARLHN